MARMYPRKNNPTNGYRLRTHFALPEQQICGDWVITACGQQFPEKDARHAWVDGDRRFWGLQVASVDCQRCLGKWQRDEFAVAAEPASH